MHNGVALLQNLRRLVTDDSFVIAIFAVVAMAAVLAFGFGAQSEIVGSVLFFGVVTAFAEDKLRVRK